MTKFRGSLFVLLLIAVGGGIWWWISQPSQTPDDSDTKLTADDMKGLVREATLGIAYLENQEFDRAVASFEEMLRTDTANRLAIRNLAISYVLPVITEGGAIDRRRDPDQYARYLEGARDAVAVLKEKAAPAPTAHLIAGKFFEGTGDLNAAVAEYQAALASAPESAEAWYALYSALRDQPDKQPANEALGRTHKLRPDNLWVLIHWLQAQAEAQDPAIVETLQQARPLIQPFAEQIQQTVRFDVMQALTTAAEKAEAGDWNTTFVQMRLLNNVMRPQTATQIDQRRIDRNLLEYIEYDIGPTLRGEPPPATASLPVEFQQAVNQIDEAGEDLRDVLVIDIDLDHQSDIVTLSRTALTAWKRGEDGRWTRLTETALDGDYDRVIGADLDRDYAATDNRQAWADPDLLVSGPSGALVLENGREGDSGHPRFSPIPMPDSWSQLQNISCSVLADVDHDGDLDLVLADDQRLHLWSNRDNMSFMDLSDRIQQPDDFERVKTLIAVDWNRDIVIDLVVGFESGRIGMLENIFHGRFRWRDLEFEDGLPVQFNSCQLMDVDRNASWDLVGSSPSGLSWIRTRSNAYGINRIDSLEAINSKAADGLVVMDFDNDGLLDLIGWGEKGNQVLEGLPSGLTRTRDELAAQLPPNITGLDPADIDMDGDLDLVVLSEGRLQLLENQGGNANNWLRIVTQGDFNPEQFPSQRVNLQGIGSLVELRVDALYQPQVVTGQWTHFGLGSHNQADALRIVWTDGVPNNEVLPQGNSLVHAVQLLKGSCPYLYTWTGERFEFFTDCLWAAPIGLQFAEGILASPREWEYLRIPGERLAERNGEYVLQLTEELWEAAYFDTVRLVVIDHPADAPVFSNEKVGPAEIAPFHIHTAATRRQPVSVTTDTGVDLTALLHARDQNYAQPFPHRIKQGLTPRHALDIGLGEITESDRVVLFLTGWVFPTDTSLNVAIGQNPDVASPMPPSLWVPDSKQDGGWRQVIPFMGFPGGKTKTIAVDISEHINPEDPRVRLVTSMEIYWDEVFLTVNEPQIEIRRTDLSPESADLHYRGFSKRVPGTNNGPEQFLYDEVTVDSPWAPMQGNLTRYGDVTELISEPDARLVVMGAGDEMTVRFKAVAEPLPPGWKRDFLLYNVGWDKDADLNTVLGQTIEPLPWKEMSGYPAAAGESPPAAADYDNYLRTWQTRTQQNRAFWRALLAP